MRIWRRCKRLSLLEQENEQGLQQNQGVGMAGKGGHLTAALSTVTGRLVMMYVSACLTDEVEDVVQTALRCLSRKDLEAAR